MHVSVWGHSAVMRWRKRSRSGRGKEQVQNTEVPEDEDDVKEMLCD